VDCPASAARGSDLLFELSAAQIRHGVIIEAEALINREHRLTLVVDAPDGETVARLLGSLSDWGDPQITAATSAEAAVGRGGCDPVCQTGGGTVVALALANTRGLG
jgi:hypothetical protein